MKRLALVLATAWLVASPTFAKGGELDAEYRTTASPEAPSSILDKASSEMDAESPAQSCGHRGWRRGFRGYGYGFGYSWGYYGYPGFGFGYGRGFGGYGRGRW
jgi:hypothetical protein